MSLIINLDPHASEAQWREFQPGVRVKIRPYVRSLVRRILRESAIAGLAGAAPEPSEKVDPDLWDKNLYRGIIEDVEGLVDAGGNQIACTSDNIGPIVDILCDQVEGFANWAFTEAQALASQITAARETETKNSKSSRGGKKTAPTA